MVACVCTECGRDYDCGDNSKLCELCKEQRPARARMEAVQEAEELISEIARSYILIDGNRIINSGTIKGWREAVRVFRPQPHQRIAMVIDIPR